MFIFFTVFIKDTDNEYSLSALAESKDIFLYRARIGLLIKGSTYTPILEYTINQDKPNQILNVEGSVTVDKAGTKRTYTFNNVRVNNDQGSIFKSIFSSR